MVFQFDGVHVVSGSLDTSIKVWDVETGTLKHTLMGHQSLTSGMELRNNILVSGNADSTVKVWDIISGRCLQTLSGMYLPTEITVLIENIRVGEGEGLPWTQINSISKDIFILFEFVSYYSIIAETANDFCERNSVVWCIDFFFHVLQVRINMTQLSRVYSLTRIL